MVASCSIVTLNIKIDAEKQQLHNIEQYVVTEILDLTSNVQENQTTQKFLDIPAHIGNKPFWIRLANDSDNMIIGTGFGNNANNSIIEKELPILALSSGVFVSNLGKAFLQCRLLNNSLTVHLESISPYSQTANVDK